MNRSSATPPKFRENQAVEFIGGMGKVKRYYFESDEWTDLVKMKLGPEPDFGTVCYETMLLLPETDMVLIAR